MGEINRLGQLAPGGEDNLGQLAPGGGGGGGGKPTTVTCTQGGKLSRGPDKLGHRPYI